VSDETPSLVDRHYVAKRLGISPSTVTHLCARREIEFVRVGSLLRFHAAAVDAYLERQTTAPAPRPPVESAPAPAARPSLPSVRRRRFS
jgi:excisionase family DNA binding protein